MDYTEYYNLAKPEVATDLADVEVLNSNMDTIDQALYDLAHPESGYFDNIYVSQTGYLNEATFRGDVSFSSDVSFSDDVSFSENVVISGYINHDMMFRTGYYPIVNDMNVVGVEANPIDSATDTLTTINIDGTVYDLGGGGTDTYSDLYVEYLHNYPGSSSIEIQTDVEITSGYSISVDGYNLVPVEANPSDTATDTLTSVNIGGTVYDISSGGGGSSVTPNPQGTPTDTLSTIGIDGTIFDIAGSGGGGGSSYTETLLYENTGTSAGDITLSDDLSNYDMLMFVVARTIGVGRELVELPYMTSDLTIGTHITLISYASEYINYDVTSMTLLTRTNSQSNYVEKVKGIKFGGGVGGGLERTLLWDYVTDNNNVIPYGLYTETLHDDIDNYDFIVAEIVSSSGDLSASGWQGTNLWTIDVNALNNTEVQNYLNYTSFGERSSRFYIKDTTFQKTTDNQGNTNGLVRVYGLKWTGGGSGTSSEIIPIPAGDGTTSRTFTLERTPKKVTLQGYTSGDGGWYESGYFIWGENFMNLIGAQYTIATGGYAGQVAISYGADGKSFTITAANAFGAFNRADSFSGMMLVDYGGGSGSSEGSGGSEVFIDSFVEEINADNLAAGFTYTPSFDCYCAFYQYSANRQVSSTVKINGTIVDSYYFENFGAHSGGVYVRAGQTMTIPHQMHNIRVRVFTLQGASSTGSLDDLSGMVWNEIVSTTSASSAVAIPPGTRILVVAAVYSGKITIVGKESMTNINKILDVSQLSTYILGGRWADQTGASYGDNSAQISYGLVTAYSSYGTVTTKVYALS